MYRNARPLDLARWQYHFEGGTQQEVVKVLAVYQNSDGGFGHALEADCWNPASSPLQTWWATQLLREICFQDKEHEMIQGILKYLASKADFVNGRWLNTIPNNNDYPCAPWWVYRDNDPGNLGFNPTIALAGFVLEYGEEESDVYATAVDLIKEATADFMASETLIEMHELACFSELATYLSSTNNEALIDYEAFITKLREQVYGTIEHDSNKWAVEYCCRPSHFIRNRNNIFYEQNKDVVRDELELIANSINDEGVWGITWQWGAHNREFAISSRWWQGNIVIVNLLMLKAFGNELDK